MGIRFGIDFLFDEKPALNIVDELGVKDSELDGVNFVLIKHLQLTQNR